MRSVLVTGATTPLGRRIVADLLEAGIECVAVGAEPLSSAGLALSSRLRYLRVDLTRPREIRDLLFGPARDAGVEAIVHGAFHRRAREEGGRVRKLNVESTRELVRLSERHPTIRRFVLRSTAHVYRVDASLPTLVDEDHPLDLSPRAPAWLRDRVESDLVVCARMGVSPLHVVVLRTSECPIADSGSQLHDYLSSPLCFRPLGYDPMLNVLAPEDLVGAVRLALHCPAQGVFNVPGKDTLPLSALVRRFGSLGLPVPGFALAPLYGLRALVTGADFRWDLNRWRFHYSGIPDGRRAKAVLGYEPRHPLTFDGSPSGLDVRRRRAA